MQGRQQGKQRSFAAEIERKHPAGSWRDRRPVDRRPNFTNRNKNVKSSAAVKSILEGDAGIEDKADQIREHLRQAQTATDLISMLFACGKKQYSFPTELLAEDVLMRLNSFSESNGTLSALDLCKAFHLMKSWDSEAKVTLAYFQLLTDQLRAKSNEDVKKVAEMDVNMALSGVMQFRTKSRALESFLLCFTQILSMTQEEKGSRRKNNTRDTLKPSSVANILFSLQGMSSEWLEVTALLRALLKKIVRHDEQYIASQIRMAFFGLQGMSSHHEDVRNILWALEHKLDQCTDSFSSFNISRTIYGLQGMSSRWPEVRKILTALVPRINSCPQTHEFTSTDTAMTLFGLQKMSSDRDEVRDVLRALAPLIERNTEVMTPEQVGDALFGMQGMKVEHEEVQEVLRLLAPKVVNSTGQYSAEAIAKALSGLRNMNSAPQYVAQILEALTARLRDCEGNIGALQITRMLRGLSNMGSDSQAIRDFLAALVAKLESSNIQMSSQATAEAMYYLDHMDQKNPEVRSVLNAIIPKTHSVGILSNHAVEDVWAPSDLAQVLYSIRFLQDSTGDVAELVTKVLSAYKSTYGSEMCASKDADATGIEDLCRSIRILSGLEMPLFESFPDSLRTDLLDVVDSRTVGDEFVDSSDAPAGPASDGHTTNAAGVSYKEFYMDLAHQAFEGHELEDFFVSVSSATSFCDFNCDLIITVTTKEQRSDLISSRPEMRINLQIESEETEISSRNAASTEFCRLRDEYLLTQGMETIRWNVVTQESLDKLFNDPSILLFKSMSLEERVMLRYRSMLDEAIRQRRAGLPLSSPT
jgi:hypothetical protein